MTDQEQKLTTAIADSKAAEKGLEQRVTDAEAKMQSALDQMAATNAALQTTVATLQTQLNQGNISGAGAPVVNQAIADLAAEVASMNAFQAVPAPAPAPAPPAPAPAP